MVVYVCHNKYWKSLWQRRKFLIINEKIRKLIRIMKIVIFFPILFIEWFLLVCAMKFCWNINLNLSVKNYCLCTFEVVKWCQKLQKFYDFDQIILISSLIQTEISLWNYLRWKKNLIANFNFQNNHHQILFQINQIKFNFNSNTTSMHQYIKKSFWNSFSNCNYFN